MKRVFEHGVESKRAPRIIAKRRPPPVQQSTTTTTTTHEPSRSIRRAAMERREVEEDDEDVLDEGVMVSGGVMMQMPNLHQQHQHLHPRRITIDAPSLPPEKPYIENPLPGVADEVESYPCRFCHDRVFLTSFGLERHTRMAHVENVDEVLNEIAHIQDEWKRREHERGRQRERVTLARIRQEALAAAAARHAATFRDSGEILHEGYGSSGDEHDHMINASSLSRGAYESCRICGLLINAQHPTALENHMRAHKKNDELRKHLLNEFGSQFVARVTCHECQLVFTDERKLISHAEAMHVRRRKYVCKWCGHVCMTMADLNMHKTDVHGMSLARCRESNDPRRMRPVVSSSSSTSTSAKIQQPTGMPPALGMRTGADPQRSAPLGNRLLTSMEELPCRTTCEVCGLLMVKPSLLIRHMMRVHNRYQFTATIETKGMPSFKVDVDRGKLTWSCCEESYNDRSSFIYHRRANHQPKLGGFNLQGNTISCGFNLQSGNTTSSSSSMLINSGGTMEISPSDVNDDEQQIQSNQQQYIVLVMDNDGNDEHTKSMGEGHQQQILLTAEQLDELGLSIDAVSAENLQVLFVDSSQEEMMGFIEESEHSALSLGPSTMDTLLDDPMAVNSRPLMD